MAKYLYAYTGGATTGTEESMRKWQQWLGGFGNALVDMGAPFARSHGGGNLSGYSIVEAASLDDAVAKSKGCPIFDSGGNVEVYEAAAM